MSSTSDSTLSKSRMLARDVMSLSRYSCAILATVADSAAGEVDEKGREEILQWFIDGPSR